MKNFKLIALLGLALFLFSCDEDDDADDHDHEHFDAHKWEFVVNGETFMEIDHGDIDPDYNDHFHLEAGTQSPTYEIEFYDHDGEESKPNLDEYSFAWRFTLEDGTRLDDRAQSEIAEIINNNGEFSFSINPLMAGEVEIQFMVYHGDHADVTTPKIKIEVEWGSFF